MKLQTIQVAFIGSLLALGQVAQASEATFYRVWQGFKKQPLTAEGFRAELPPFMRSTVTLYQGRGLNNYIVAVPPADKPSFIPDEFALIAFESQDSYLKVRATAPGKAYGEKHWEIFDKSVSASAPFVNYPEAKPETLTANTAYDVIAEPVDWAGGYTSFYLGTRKAGLEPAAFLKELSVHVGFVAGKLAPAGLKGYIIIANPDYEIAYMNWSSKAAFDSAFAGAAGKSVAEDGARILDTLMFQAVEPFGQSAEPAKAYTAFERSPVASPALVVDPRAHAETSSKLEAEGDFNDDSGWAGCAETTSGDLRTFDCSGTRRLLVFGGHESVSPFSCHFDFRSDSLTGLSWLLAESCD